MESQLTCNYSCIYYNNSNKDSDGIDADDIDLTRIIAGQNVIAVAYIGIGVLGILLNMFVLWIFSKAIITKARAFRSLLINLVVADLLSAFGVILLGAKTLFIIDTTKQNLSSINNNQTQSFTNETLRTLNAICNSSYIIFFLTNFVSALTLTSLAIERYRVFIIHGLQEGQNVQLRRWKINCGIGYIWFISTGSSMLFYLVFEVTAIVNNRCFFANHPQYCYYNNAVTVIVAALFCVIPGIVMIFCYCSICVFLCNHRPPEQETAQTVKRFGNEKQGAILSIIITIIFIITMTPFMAYLVNVTWTYCNADEFLMYMLTFHYEGRVRFDEAAHFLFILPPIINPICYFFSSSHFRHAAITIGKKRLKATSDSIRSLSQTRL